MKQTLTFLAAIFLSATLFSQVNFTANQSVVPYTGKFRPGMNQGFYPNLGWDNRTLADLSAGNAAVGQRGVGSKTNRQGLYEEVLGIPVFGYDLNVPDFAHYAALGMGEHVAIVGGPLAWHKDFSTSSYCTNPASPNFGVQSNLFGNLYTPVWDGGANGTPYNDDNYWAAYLYKVVSQYKDQVRFWEIWNEPGLDLTGQLGWRDQNFPGNWWQEGPDPCDNILHAPLYHYIRTLRIAWDVIKTVDPDSYVCLGSVGYQSFMNALLNNTDNPNGGDVSAAYPLKGGAYFDCITYHSYPHFDGSTTNYDAQFFERHSDEAADGVVKYRDYYQQILNQYGYDGVTFPKKEWIMTETNSPRKVFGEAFPGSGLGPFFGGVDQQINHMMKAMMIAKINKVHQLHIFQLIDQRNEADANYEFHLMGMYKNLSTGPYNAVLNDVGKAMKTITDLVYDTEYDATRTAAMNLSAGARGYAFRRPDGSYVYAIWAKTTDDLSENASATYSFPASFGLTTVTRYNWDYGYSNASQVVAPSNIQLNARPIFFSAGGTQPPPCSISAAVSNVQCSDNGTPTNPADDTFTFTLTVNGSGTSGTWSAVVNGQTVTGAVGTPKVLGPYSISGGGIGLTIRDASNSACVTETFATAPAPCSTSNPPGTYCSSTSDFPWHDWIAGVQVGSINNPSGKSIYSNFTSQTTNLANSTNHPIALTAGFSWFTYGENWRVWIDFNKNGTFEASEKVLEGTQTAPPNGTASAVFNSNLNIPAGAATGATRMRISMKRGAFADPCELLPFGEVEDYTVNITGGTPPPSCSISAATSNIICNDNGTSATGDDTFTFNLTVNGTGTSASGWTATINGQNSTGTYGTAKAMGPYPISGGNLSIAVRDNTTATCTATASAAAPAPCSNTNPPPPPGVYCTSTSDFPWHDWIAGVQIGSINSPSGKSVYSNFTSQTANLSRGVATPITLTAGYSWLTYNEFWRIWIDFNKNNSFDDAGELVFSGQLNAPANGTATGVLTGNFTVPAGATPGSTRMRISMKRDGFATSCEKLPFGEGEDYTVNILNNLQPGSGDTRSQTNQQAQQFLEKDAAGFALFPNPAQHSVFVNLKNFAGQAGTLSVFNSQGKLVRSQDLTADTPQIFELETFDWTEGYYFLQIRCAGRRPAVQKLSVIRY